MIGMSGLTKLPGNTKKQNKKKLKMNYEFYRNYRNYEFLDLFCSFQDC